MMLLDSWNTVYRAKFDEDAQNLNDDFDSKEDAISYAKEHLESKPTVLGVEVLLDDTGSVIDEGDPEVLFSYADELSEDVKVEPAEDELAAKLRALEDESSTDTVIKAEPEDSVEVAVEKVLDGPCTQETSTKLVADEEESAGSKDDDGVIEIFGRPLKITNDPIVDPLNQDFSDISKDEAEYTADVESETSKVSQDGEFGSFIADLAKQLGISFDDITFYTDEPAIPEVSPIETTEDSEEFPEPVADTGTVSPVDFTLGDDLVADEPKQEEPVIDQISEPVAAEVVVTAEVPPEVIDQIKSNDVKVQIPVDKSVDVEPEKKACCKCCGEEGCECEPKECESECQNENLVEDADVTVDSLSPEMKKHIKIAADFRKKLAGEGLKEAAHVSKCNEELDQPEAYKKALELANKEGKPVIYGYFGSSNFGKGRYHEIKLIVCDDLAKCTAEVETKYQPDGSILVAYPANSKIFKSTANNINEEDMSDVELAQKLESVRQERLSKCKEEKCKAVEK